VTTTTLFDNVRVFDGLSDRLSDTTSVLVSGGVITAIGEIPVPAPGEVRTVIAGGGRTLMPGLIDAHVHLTMGIPLPVAVGQDPLYIGLVAGSIATETLMRGFTSVRDAGGPVFGIKNAIDHGIVLGPRVWPSGALISQTSGHGDFRGQADFPRGVCGHLSHFEQIGVAVIADGVPEVLRGVREQLARGASQIKVMAGGGVASPNDPLDVTQYTESELRAAVEAAEDWGTYVLVHAYTPKSITRAVGAGVKCVEHGQLADEAAVEAMAENDVWWSLQPFLADEFATQHANPTNRAKQLRVANGTDTAYELARKHNVKVAWGTDALFDQRVIRLQGAQLARMTRWYTPAEVLQMATSVNGELLQMSGERSPYPGRLGVVEAGALADLLLVDGNPLENLDLVADAETNFVVIMKAGVVYKNSLPSA